MGPAGYPVLVPQFESALEAKQRYLTLKDLVDQRRVRDLQVRRLELQEQEDQRKREEEERFRQGLATLPADADAITTLRILGPRGLPLAKELDDARNAKLTREKTEAELNTTKTNFRTTQGKVLRDAVAAALEEDDDERRHGMIRGFGQRMVDYGIAGQEVVNGAPMTRDQLKALHQRLFIETEGLPGWEKELARREKEKRDVEAFNVAQRTATANATVAERNALGEAVSPAPVLPQKWYEGWLQANNRRDSPTNYYRAFSEWKVLDAPTPGVDVTKDPRVVQQQIDAAVETATRIDAAKAATTKPSADLQKKLLALKNYRDAVKMYRAELDKTGPTVMPGQGARLKALYTDLTMQAKSAYELGALAGPDLAILQGSNTDPTTIEGSWILGKKGLGQQLDVQESIIKRNENSLQEVYGTPGGGSPPPPRQPAGGNRPPLDSFYRK